VSRHEERYLFESCCKDEQELKHAFVRIPTHEDLKDSIVLAEYVKMKRNINTRKEQG